MLTIRVLLLATLQFFAMYTQGVYAFQLVPGDLYSSNYSSNTISHYTASGVYLESISLSTDLGSETRGIAFGPDGLLYVVMVTENNFAVVAIDGAGAAHATYNGPPGYIKGDISYGKIAFGQSGKFYVAGATSLVAFTLGELDGSIIYSTNQVFDVNSLPSGNLLVLSAYQLQEISTAGSVIRSISPDSDVDLVDARGVEYDPVNDEIFVFMLGYSDYYDQLMRLDGTTGHLKNSVTFGWGNDLLLTLDRRLVVGSRLNPPSFFDLTLIQGDSLTGGQQMFIAQMPIIDLDAVFRDSFESAN